MFAPFQKLLTVLSDIIISQGVYLGPMRCVWFGGDEMPVFNSAWLDISLIEIDCFVNTSTCCTMMHSFLRPIAPAFPNDAALNGETDWYKGLCCTSTDVMKENSRVAEEGRVCFWRY